MAKYIVWASKCYEIEVEAQDEHEAYDQAFSTPLNEWKDEYEMVIEVEKVIDEHADSTICKNYA